MSVASAVRSAYVKDLAAIGIGDAIDGAKPLSLNPDSVLRTRRSLQGTSADV